MDEDAPIVCGIYEKIKNPKFDGKKGIVMPYYWAQAQSQMICCDLDECDFWQMKIVEYANYDEFLDDTNPTYPWLSKATSQEKEVVIQLLLIDKVESPLSHDEKVYNCAEFIYQPKVDMTLNEIDRWISDTLQNLRVTHSKSVFDTIKYYKVEQSRCVLLMRDDKWFNENLSTFEKIWSQIEFLRNDKNKAILLKRYIQTFSKDRYGKTLDAHTKDIMDTIEIMCTNSSEAQRNKSILKKMEDAINTAHIPPYIDPGKVSTTEENVNTELKDIMGTMTTIALDKSKDKKEYIEIIKKAKDVIDKYLSKN